MITQENLSSTLLMEAFEHKRDTYCSKEFTIRSNMKMSCRKIGILQRQYLTGAPCCLMMHSKDDDLWQLERKFQYLVLCATTIQLAGTTCGERGACPRNHLTKVLARPKCVIPCLRISTLLIYSMSPLQLCYLLDQA